MNKEMQSNENQIDSQNLIDLQKWDAQREKQNGYDHSVIKEY